MFVVTSHFWLLAVYKNEGRRPTSVANQNQFRFGYVQWTLLYRSDINLCEYKMMQIGQFWRLLNFMWFLIMRFYCQKDSSYMTRNLWKEQDEEKKAACILRAMYNALLRHKFVGSTIRHTFEYIFFVSTTRSKPYTKSSSTLDYMNIV